MPRLRRDDGVEISWDSRGEGPNVILVPHVNSHPSVFEPLIAALEADHRVVRYDARGYGDSTRRGPHDPETLAGDLLALAEEAGAGAVAVALADATGPAVRAAVRRRDLVESVVAVGTAPVPREALGESESLISSQSVVDALLEQLGTDYRGALRSVLTAANQQMSEDEVRERVAAQVAYAPQEAVTERFRAWSTDDPLEFGRELGDRLSILTSPDIAGFWFPSGEELRLKTEPLLPEAHQEVIADGIISRPELTAEIIRRASRGG